MKKSQARVFSQLRSTDVPSVITQVLLMASALAVSAFSVADEPGYRVVLEDLPGASEIEAGKGEVGIRMLEDQLDQTKVENSGDIWSTLCAAYIENLALAKAELACNKAVEISPTYHALNNRGVYRLHKGDLVGAREDFERVRPPDVDAYLEMLKTTNVRLVAATNFELLNQFLANRSNAETKSLQGLSPASIEELDN